MGKETMNQLSHERMTGKGFEFRGGLENGIAETLELLKGIIVRP